jgi:Zn-finger nucleic acid-binding protein
MDCPRDHCVMKTHRDGKYPRFQCPMCLGILVLEKDLVQTLGYKDDRRFEAVAKVKVANVKDSAIACPQDGATLKAVKYLNTELDVCPKCHALWMDYGELEKVFRRLDEEVVKARPESRKPGHKGVVEYEEAPLTADDALDFLRGTVNFFRIFNRLL